MKHLHILMAVLTIAIFVYQAIQVFGNKSASLPKSLKIGSHVIYTILVIAGIMLVMPLAKSVGTPFWVIAKIVLFIVAISATIKAIRAGQDTANADKQKQAKAGMVIAGIAYCAIVFLAISKPAIGFLG